MELRHWGIILTVLGAVLLAYSLKIDPGYDDKDPELKKIHEDAAKNGKYRSSKCDIIPWRFRGGLVFVAVGSFLQW